MVSLNIEFITVVLLKSGLGFNNKINNIVNALIEDCLIKLAAVYRRDNSFCIEWARRRHFKIGAVFKAGNSVYRSAPVRYEQTLKAPFVSEHFFLEPFVLRSVNAVNAVIRVHNRPRLRFLNRDFKCGEIDFAHCAFINYFAEHHTESLLRVAGKVLK